ncbi:hypothetical protein F5X96DRAFT_619069 [Biscogniauxia mediterranea]|nr:hypothetical protein F5X96DRAFT_619069 [Biscogniauxia mediterranea]
MPAPTVAASRGPTMMRSEEDKTSLTQVRVHPIPRFEDDLSTIGDDWSDASSICSTPDKNNHGWNNFRVRDPNIKMVYEAWEMISVRPTSELRTTAQVLGVNVYSTYTLLKDGYTGVRAVPSYSQGELASMVAAAEDKYNNRSGFKFLSRITRRASYAQNLAERLFALPGCLPNKLGALIDSRFVATNKSQFARREWKIVLLKPLGDVMTDEAPEIKGRGLLARLNPRQRDPVQKWLVVLRGHETKASQAGFEAFDTFANPWLKVDQRLERDHSESRKRSTSHWGTR